MLSLSSLQNQFAASLVDPRVPPPGFRSVVAGTDQTRRFDVYRNNMASSLIEALEATYPVVKQLVGKAFFQTASKLYIQQDPPSSPVIHEYGGTFPEFLESFEPAAVIHYLGDVARLEWSRLMAYHAADADSRKIHELAKINDEAIDSTTFVLHPSLTILRSHKPSFSIWADCIGIAEIEGVEMDQGEDFMTYRDGWEICTQRVPPGGFAFIQSLSRGQSLGQASQTAHTEDPAFDLAEHLRGLFEMGLVTDIIQNN